MKNILLVLLVVGCISCDDEEMTLNTEIYYGTSFGECIGYCITETRIDAQNVEVTRKGWRDEAIKVANGSLSTDQRDALIAGIDLEKFENLPTTIGCPDCADGGAEWLELTVNGERKKVSFEYMTDIEGIAQAVHILRDITEDLDPVQ